MNRFEEQLHTVSQDIRLSEDERVLMREKLEEYMAFKPIREDVVAHKPEHTPIGFVEALRTRYVPAMLGLALVFGGGGVAAAAEQSLPGEALYSVKVNFNEELIGALSLSDIAKTDWEVTRAERRLQEASEMASRGILTDDLKEQVVEQFTRHASRVAKQAKEIGGVNPAYAAEVSTEFETSLDAHEAILVSLAVEDDASNAEAKDLASAVRSAAKEVALVRREAEEVVAVAFYIEDDATTSVATISEGPNPDSLEKREDLTRGMRSAASDNLDAVERAIRRARVVHSDLDLTAIEEQYASAQERFKEGNAHLAEQELSDAYHAFKDVVTICRTTLRYLNAQTELELETLPFDIVVPETPDDAPLEDETLEVLVADDAETDEEVHSDAHAQLTELKEKAALHADEKIRHRAERALKRAEALLIRSELAAESDDRADSYRYAKTAQSILDDVSGMLMETDDRDTPVDEPVVSEPAPTPVQPIEEPVDEPVVEDKETLSITHSFSDGMHTYTGWVTTPTPCYTVSTDGVVAESFPEQISIEITLTPTGEVCPAVLDSKSFEIEAGASEAAILRSVRVNGESVPFTVIAQATALSDELEIIEEVVVEEQSTSSELVEEADETEEESFTYRGTRALIEGVLDDVVGERHTN